MGFIQSSWVDRNFCPECGARLLTNNLETFPGLVFVMLGSLDRLELIEPKLEMFTKRRLKWAKPLDLPQFSSMPSRTPVCGSCRRLCGSAAPDPPAVRSAHNRGTR